MLPNIYPSWKKYHLWAVVVGDDIDSDEDVDGNDDIVDANVDCNDADS